MPLYIEKDAIYAYHFYRLLQRAKKICITYDSETDSFGKGEKSRFVTQLQLEFPVYTSNITIKEHIAGYQKLPGERNHIFKIKKTDAVLAPIFDKALSFEMFKGLSPSSLISFKDCSLRFYFRYSAGIKESETVEESAENNTMGSILHLSLETLYKDVCGKPLNKSILESKQHLIPKVVRDSFVSFFDNNEPDGKGLLQEEVIKAYVGKQVKQDLLTLTKLGEEQKSLHLLHLEHELSASIKIDIEGKRHNVFIKGKADRIDRYGNFIRIIDYKSSIKTIDKFEFSGFENLFTEPNFNKQLQLFIYAWLSYKNKIAASKDILPCIIAFKEYKDEPVYLTYQKSVLNFSDQLFEDFEIALSEFIKEIFNKDKVFEQTENQDLCQYCNYKLICNRI